MRRWLMVLSLFASCALTMGAGWLSGPRFGPGVGPGFAPVAVAPMRNGMVKPDVPRSGLIFEGLKDVWTKSDETHVSNFANQIAGKPDFYQNIGAYQPTIGPNGGLELKSGKHLRVSRSLFSSGSNVTALSIVMKMKFYGLVDLNGILFREDDPNGAYGALFIYLSDARVIFRYSSANVIGTSLPTSSSGLFGCGFDNNGCMTFNSTTTNSASGSEQLIVSDSDWVLGYDLAINDCSMNSEVEYLYVYDHKLSSTEISQFRSAFQ